MRHHPIDRPLRCAILLLAAVGTMAAMPRAGAAGPEETPIAMCRRLPDGTLPGRGWRSGCLCSAEGSEVPLPRREYELTLAAWRTAGMLTSRELAALQQERAIACEDADAVPELGDDASHERRADATELLDRQRRQLLSERRTP